MRRTVVYPVFHPGASIEERVTGHAHTPWYAGFAEGDGPTVFCGARPTEAEVSDYLGRKA